MAKEGFDNAIVSRLGRPRSGYYAAQQCRKNSAVDVTPVQLLAVFQSSQRTYGSRRLIAALNARRIAIGRYKVRRLMPQAVLGPLWKRKWARTTESHHTLPVASNRLNRQFNPA